MPLGEPALAGFLRRHLDGEKRMVLRWAAACVLICSVALAPLPARARVPDQRLVAVASMLRNLSFANFNFVVDWSSRPVAPSNSFFDYERAEAAIVALHRRDREAVLAWLQSRGRQALYDRGLSDDQIGPSRFPIDTFPSGNATATPPPAWHTIPFVSGTLGSSAQAGIAIRGGFAAVKNDATAEAHCVSFTNVDPRTAVRVRFGYQFLDRNRSVLASLESVREGTFSPNIDIDGPPNYTSYVATQSGAGMPRSALQNCWQNDNGTAAFALLGARYFVFRVLSVTYADGSTSSAASP